MRNAGYEGNKYYCQYFEDKGMHSCYLTVVDKTTGKDIDLLNGEEAFCAYQKLDVCGSEHKIDKCVINDFE